MEKINFKNLPDKTTPLNAQNLNKIQENVENEINRMKPKILWQNPNPTVTFNEQDIILNSDDYDMLLVIYKEYKGQIFMMSNFTVKGLNVKLIDASDYGASGNYYIATYLRRIVRNSDTSFHVNSCFVHYNSGTTNKEDNNYLIPLYFIGYKTGLFN